jgi:hypothetical protein
MRRWIALHLVFLADRIAPEDAFRHSGMSFEFVENVGVEWNWDGHGCPIWYSGQEDYRRAWERNRTKGDGLSRSARA